MIGNSWFNIHKSSRVRGDGGESLMDYILIYINEKKRRVDVNVLRTETEANSGHFLVTAEEEVRHGFVKRAKEGTKGSDKDIIIR